MAEPIRLCGFCGRKSESKATLHLCICIRLILFVLILIRLLLPY